MARTVLPTNFVDDVLNSLMGGKRRYRMINNADGTVSFEDATTYDVEGSIFGASRVNEIARNVNESADVAEVGDMENLPVPTDTITENIGSLGEKLPSDILGFSVGEDEKPYITYKVGADSVTKKLGELDWELVLNVYIRRVGARSQITWGWADVYDTTDVVPITVTKIDDEIEFNTPTYSNTYQVGYDDFRVGGGQYYNYYRQITTITGFSVESFEYL